MTRGLKDCEWTRGKMKHSPSIILPLCFSHLLSHSPNPNADLPKQLLLFYSYSLVLFVHFFGFVLGLLFTL